MVWIGSAFSGVIGVGFYPILGNRVWCRFGCPMAAILGLQQRLFSRFRITTKWRQCMCGTVLPTAKWELMSQLCTKGEISFVLLV
jgi:polyferredoxin